VVQADDAGADAELIGWLYFSTTTGTPLSEVWTLGLASGRGSMFVYFVQAC
jgi:hypothetical protein